MVPGMQELTGRSQATCCRYRQGALVRDASPHGRQVPAGRAGQHPALRRGHSLYRRSEAWRGGAVPGAGEGAFCPALWAPMYLTVAGFWEDRMEASAQLQRGAPGKGVEGVAVSSWQQMPPGLPCSGQSEAVEKHRHCRHRAPSALTHLRVNGAQRWSRLWLLFQVSPGRADVSDFALCGASHCAHTDSQE